MVFDTGLEARVNGRSLISHFLFQALPNASRPPQNGDGWQEINTYHGRKTPSLEAKGATYACYCSVTSTGWWNRKAADGGLEGGCLWGSKKGAALPTALAADGTLPTSLVRIHDRRVRTEAGGGGSPLGARAVPGSLNFGSLPVQNASTLHLEQETPTESVVKEVIRLGRGAAATEAAPQPVRKGLSLRGITSHKDLPRDFDWRKELAAMVPPGEDPLGAQIDQGNCGSCYAFAGTMMLQMRFRVQLYRKHGILYPLELSYKSVTRCSPYTEGCSGGFSFFTSRVAKEIGVPLAECDSAVSAGALDQVCDWACYKNSSNLFYARDYWHVGGFSHGSDEQSIMREIYLNGPCELGFSTTAVPEFVRLSGQSNYPETDVMTIIVNSKTLKEMYSSNPEVHRWWYATHAILSVGWGEDTATWGSVKYWIVRNSWGRGWGQNGYAKMRRGNNDGGIETDAAAVDPDMAKLPAGFLEKAKKYNEEQLAVRAGWQAQSKGKQEHHGKAGLPDYCKKRPDSPDCK